MTHFSKLMQTDLFGCFDWKFKLQKVLGKGVLIPKFNICCFWAVGFTKILASGAPVYYDDLKRI